MALFYAILRYAVFRYEWSAALLHCGTLRYARFGSVRLRQVRDRAYTRGWTAIRAVRCENG